jgi:hypothetical protein
MLKKNVVSLLSLFCLIIDSCVMDNTDMSTYLPVIPVPDDTPVSEAVPETIEPPALAQPPAE